MINIGSFLTRRALLEPQKIGIVEGDRRLTFSEMNQRANRLARALAAHQIGRGDRVAVLFRNCIEYYDFYFALAKLGAIMTGINWRLARAEIRYILENCGAKLFAFDGEFGDKASGLHQELPDLNLEVVIGSAVGNGAIHYDELVWDISTDPLNSKGGDDDALLLVYTSGTTGHPKGALLTHNQMFWCSSTISHTLDHRQTDINLLPLPLYHVGGISFVTTFVHLGSTAVLLREWGTSQALRTIEREGVNHFMAVPTMLDGILNYPNLDRYNLKSLRWLLASAAPVPSDLIKAYFDRGILVLQSYGLTETAGPATVTPKAMAIDKAGSAGLPFFHTDVRLVKEDGKEAQAGEVGEVYIRGPHVISGYWHNEKENRKTFVDGWFCSGDLATKDSDGFLTIVDRKKDMIISGGENIYPAELERFLYAHPKISELAIIGLPNTKWGEIVCAVAHLRQGEVLTLEELQDYCEGRIARFKMPRKLILRQDPLPRNPTGKLLKDHLRNQIINILEQSNEQ